MAARPRCRYVAAVSTTRVQVCGRLAVTWEGVRVEERLPARQGRLLFAFLVRKHLVAGVTLGAVRR